MSKFNAAAIALGSLGLTVLCAMANVGQCAVIFGLIAVAFGGLFYLKTDRDARLPQAMLDAHASKLTNQHHYRPTLELHTPESSLMVVPPPLED